jgi:hypothetical protein
MAGGRAVRDGRGRLQRHGIGDRLAEQVGTFFQGGVQSVAQAVEVALGVERRHAAGAGAGHGLLVDVVLHVAGGEHAGDAGGRGVAAAAAWVTM